MNQTSNEEEETLLLATAAVLVAKRPYKKKSEWASPFFDPAKRGGPIKEAALSKRFGFRYVLKVDEEEFVFLLRKISPLIQRLETPMRPSVSPEIRLGLTLRYLATGDAYRSLELSCKVSHSVIVETVPETCEALAVVLRKYMQFPTTEEEWKMIADRFFEQWHFPNCCGSADGKHVVMQAPRRSGSIFRNYKGTFSLVLLALVNADKNFIYINVGCQGRVSDGGVLKNSGFGKKIEDNSLNLPQPRRIAGSSSPLPFVFIGDDAFPLGENFLKPILGSFDKGTPERVFNYHLSSARNTVEGAFGILTSMFRAFRKPLLQSVEHVEKIVYGACFLYNFVRRNVHIENCPYDSEAIPLEERENFIGDLPPQEQGRRRLSEGEKTRSKFMQYFVSDFSKKRTPWQSVM